MATNVLFLCPHNAAKSVAAAALFVREAGDRKLDVVVSTAGTDPDPEVLPAVQSLLEAEGLAPLPGPPRRVAAGDLDLADRIINIGCDHADLPTSNEIDDWAVPNFSDNAGIAYLAIKDHVHRLCDEVAAAQR